MFFLNDCSDDEDDLLRHKRFLYAKGNSIISRFKDCTDEVKTRLFKTFCHNVYGGHLWSQYKQSSMGKVVVAFNDVYRKLFGIRRGVSMSGIYVQNNLDGFKTLLRKASFNFRNRLLESINEYVTVITRSVFFYCESTLTHSWAHNLFT